MLNHDRIEEAPLLLTQEIPCLAVMFCGYTLLKANLSPKNGYVFPKHGKHTCANTVIPSSRATALYEDVS